MLSLEPLQYSTLNVGLSSGLICTAGVLKTRVFRDTSLLSQHVRTALRGLGWCADRCSDMIDAKVLCRGLLCA